ncbi:MAG TPA: c-type cytochrome [Candidatus Acidoferrales bacterium]|nr:c-type cytochrome [Candidatus Acidoferrales bacterium]
MPCLSAVVGAVWMFGAATAAAVPVPAQEGRTLYVEACASCHGIDLAGNGPVAAALTVPPPDLTRLAQRNQGKFPRELVIEVVTAERTVAAHGTREMPVWSQRFDPTGSGATAAAAIYIRRRVELITTYIESLQRNDTPP